MSTNRNARRPPSRGAFVRQLRLILRSSASAVECRSILRDAETAGLDPEPLYAEALAGRPKRNWPKPPTYKQVINQTVQHQARSERPLVDPRKRTNLVPLLQRLLPKMPVQFDEHD